MICVQLHKHLCFWEEFICELSDDLEWGELCAKIQMGKIQAQADLITTKVEEYFRIISTSG